MLDREQILAAMRVLDEELGRLGVRGEMFVVGGAAMALAYDARRSTVDVDAIFAPTTEIRTIALFGDKRADEVTVAEARRHRDRELVATDAGSESPDWS